MRTPISIIIPLYNGENFIEKCLDSVRRQKYVPLEIVIVNDESKDASVECIREYGKKHHISVSDRMADEEEIEHVSSVEGTKIVLVHQKNQGQGAARNTGIRMARGRYICFLDQDDTMEPGILCKMEEKAQKESADIVAAGYRRVTPDGKIKQEVSLRQTEWSKYRVIAPWSKLYCKEFIEKNKIGFLPVVLGEDIYFLMQAYSYSPKVVFLEDIGYNWLDNSVSVSNTAHKVLKEETSLLKLFDMLESLERAEELRKDKQYEYFLIKTAVWDVLYTARSNSYADVSTNCKRIWGWFETHFPKYIRNPYIRIGMPKGEGFAVRLIVWGYMVCKRLHLENLFLRVLSK